MANIQQPRKHCLATHKTVMGCLVDINACGLTVFHDKCAGTVKAYDGDVVIYQAIQKGEGLAPWIVSYRTDYFG